MPKKVNKIAYQLNYDFFLIGIASSENDYRLSWSLNTQFGYKFQKIDDLFIDLKKNDCKQCYSRYHFFDEDTLLDYFLISNKTENGLLIKEYHNLDFFLKIMGEPTVDDLNIMLQNLKTTPNILMAIPIEPSSLKNPENFLF